jgi:hypothetical protein
MMFAPPNQPGQKTRVCPRPPFEFDEEALMFQCTRKEIDTAVITVAFYAAAKPISNLVASVNIPAQPRGRGQAPLHVRAVLRAELGQVRDQAARVRAATEDKHGHPEAERAGALSVGTHLPSFQTLAPGAFPVIKTGGKAGEFSIDAAAKDARPPPLLQAIETAIATTPSATPSSSRVPQFLPRALPRL